MIPHHFDKKKGIQKVDGDDEFRSLDLSPNKSLNMRSYGRKVYKRVAVHPPHSNKMPTDEDWPSVSPIARSFHPASFPLPLHQDYVVPGATPPGKFANAEMMKIPNFKLGYGRQAAYRQLFCSKSLYSTECAIEMIQITNHSMNQSIIHFFREPWIAVRWFYLHQAH
ncbi:28S ribosomal protein S35, mitochondrial-like isoform X2 [Daphnia pulicaria]|uniref:28S ribosomal protein S35, mitochondrial-like isoform X2 n=1 Tax=Daphnia pulicaria TaxID=35523 RepID=UPI001EEC058D|nr:28S ribosomal protein S35, mitochondrial-like isoform X2 [Daphnia pulicaria]XP_046638689.1 28S ribosomal protein S35, mitochondrial-like isoform X2 [Daphnia pulicaria]